MIPIRWTSRRVSHRPIGWRAAETENPRATQGPSLKILRVHNYYREPGGEDAVEQAERELCIDMGCNVVLYTRDNREIDDYSPWQASTLAPRAVWAWDTRRELATLIERERPDVAHFTNPFPLISPAAYAACRRAGVAVVQSLHNYRLLCPAATFYRNGDNCTECIDHSLARSVRHACYRGSRAATATVAGTLAPDPRLCPEQPEQSHGGSVRAGGSPGYSTCPEASLLPDHLG